MGEIFEIGCVNGKLCCVNEGENKKYLKFEKLFVFLVKFNENKDYIILFIMIIFIVEL